MDERVEGAVGAIPSDPYPLDFSNFLIEVCVYFRLMSTLRDGFIVEAQREFPLIHVRLLRLYTALRLRLPPQ
jgi:hypothetical protein